MGTKELETLLSAARPLIELAIAEDIGPGVATSASTLDARMTLHGRIVVKAPGGIAGLPVAEAVFKQLDPTIGLGYATSIKDSARPAYNRCVLAIPIFEPS